MENKEFTELIDQIVKYLDAQGLAICIVRKPKMLNYGTEYYSQKYGETNVRQRREAMGMTAYQLAKRMGVDRNVVLRIERKDMLHTEKSMKIFADYFGCTIEDLLVGDENE